MSIACCSKMPPLGNIEHIWWGIQFQDYVGDLPHIHALTWLPKGSSEEDSMLAPSTDMTGCSNWPCTIDLIEEWLHDCLGVTKKCCPKTFVSRCTQDSIRALECRLAAASCKSNVLLQDSTLSSLLHGTLFNQKGTTCQATWEACICFCYMLQGPSRMLVFVI